MRMDAREAGPASVHWAVYLDGQELKTCLMADEEAGLVLCLTDEALVERRGRVELKPLDPRQALASLFVI